MTLCSRARGPRTVDDFGGVEDEESRLVDLDAAVGDVVLNGAHLCERLAEGRAGESALLGQLERLRRCFLEIFFLPCLRRGPLEDPLARAERAHAVVDAPRPEPRLSAHDDMWSERETGSSHIYVSADLYLGNTPPFEKRAWAISKPRPWPTPRRRQEWSRRRCRARTISRGFQTFALSLFSNTHASWPNRRLGEIRPRYFRQERNARRSRRRDAGLMAENHGLVSAHTHVLEYHLRLRKSTIESMYVRVSFLRERERKKTLE